MDETFDVILAYSVLHYLLDEEEVTKFIDKTLNMLKPGGRALFGNIPNTSTKQRFINSKHGKRFLENSYRKMKKNPPSQSLEFE